MSYECHISSQWSGFRPAMRRLANSLHHPSMPMQRVLLCATIPPPLTADIEKKHGLLSGYRLLREKKTRKNLSYSVITVPDSRLQSAEDTVWNKEVHHVLKEVEMMANCSQKGTKESPTPRKHQIILYVPFRNMVRSVTSFFRSERDKKM